MNPRISIIAAISKKRGLGKDNKLLWHIPEDLKRFKVLTTGHPVIIGRKTYESISRPLPNRINIVVTRESDYKVDGAIVAHSVEEAIEKAKEVESEEIFIIGGGQIYQEAISFTDRLYLTLVEGDYEADTFFPEYTEFKKLISQEEGESEGYKYQFLTLER